jgi:serine/threonine-protein kinase
LKVRHTFPAGQTSASKIKALLLCLTAKKGEKAAQAFLTTLRLARTDLDDETRRLPLAALHEALRAFDRLLPKALADVTAYLVAPDNLGAWARLLRGARTPADVFSRLDSSDSEHGRTTRWETTSGHDGYWRGKVHIAHDPVLEEDGFLAEARALELAVVPMLFGFARARVVQVASSAEVQEFEVRWSAPSPVRPVAAAFLGGALVASGVVAWHASATSIVVAAATPLVLSALALGWSRDRARRIATTAQTMRVHALERSLAIREMDSRRGAGDIEGHVIAGHYRIGARMGAGASGVIYRATRLTDGLPVAIKLLRAATAHDAVASDRLRREAEALGLAWHPNVVEVIEHGHLPDGTS